MKVGKTMNQVIAEQEQADDPEEAERQNILRQKRVLRRYLRLKRNNFVTNHEHKLTDAFYIESFMPKIEKILRDN